MKGRIEKYEPFRKGSWLYRLEYKIIYKPKDYTEESMAVRVEDMDEFVNDIKSAWKKEKKEQNE